MSGIEIVVILICIVVATVVLVVIWGCCLKAAWADEVMMRELDDDFVTWYCTECGAEMSPWESKCLACSTEKEEEQ